MVTDDLFVEMLRIERRIYCPIPIKRASNLLVIPENLDVGLR